MGIRKNLLFLQAKHQKLKWYLGDLAYLPGGLLRDKYVFILNLGVLHRYR